MIYFFIYYVYHSTVAHNFDKMSFYSFTKEKDNYNAQDDDITITAPDDSTLKNFIDNNVHELEQNRLDTDEYYTIRITKSIFVNVPGLPIRWTFIYSNDRYTDNDPQHKLENYNLIIERASKPRENTGMYEQYERCRLTGDDYPYNDIIALSSQLHIGTYIVVDLINAKSSLDIPLSVLGLFNFCNSIGKDKVYHDYVKCEDYEMSSYWLFSGGCKSDQCIHVNEMKNHDSIGENKILTTFYLAIQRLNANGTIVPITILEFSDLFKHLSFSILHYRNPRHDMYYPYQR